MSPEQEAKLDKLITIVTENNIKTKSHEHRLNAHAIKIDKINEDRHKAVGAVAVLGGLGFLGGIGSLVASLFKD